MSLDQEKRIQQRLAEVKHNVTIREARIARLLQAGLSDTLKLKRSVLWRHARIDFMASLAPKTMLAYYTIELTIRIPRNWMTQSRATSLGTEMATFRDGDKWPSISERRSPTETASICIDLDRTRMPACGLIELAIRIPRN